MKKGKKTILALTAALCMSAAVAGFAACGGHTHVDIDPQDGICDECGDPIEGYVPSTGYTVTFDTQGGSAVSPQGVTAGGKAVKPGNPSKPGKVFAGWYKDAACTDGQEFDFNAAISADVTVYAKWTEAADTADTYFNFADVEGGVSISLKTGQALPADVKLPAKHENKDVVAIAARAFEEQKTIRSITIPASVKSIATRAFRNCTNLAAIAGAENVEEIGASAFAGTKYETDLTVGEVYIGKTFYKYGGSLFADTAITVKDGTLGIAAGAFQSLAKLTGITLPAGLTNIGSYAFGGTGLSTVAIPDSVTKIADNAFRDAASLKTVTLGSAVTSVGATAFSGCPVESVTVKAETAPAAGANILGLPATFDGVIFVPAAKVEAYKAAAGWSNYADRIVSVTAQKRTVTFNVGTGATAVEAQSLYEGLKPTQPATNPTRDGYFFKGWVTSDGGDTPFDFTAPITGDTTVYAKWAEAVTVTFNTGNGGSEVAAQVIEKGTKATQPKQNPTRDGYFFKGWVTTENGSDAFDFAGNINSNTTVYAKWAEAVTVTFSTGDGGSEVAAQTIEKGTQATKPKADPTREGYIFKGWVTTQDGDTPFDFGGAVQSATTVYAKWVEAVTVTFEMSGAPGIASKTVGKGDTIEAPQASEYRDHLFGGWYTQDGSTSGDWGEEFNFNAPITGNTTVYAKWYEYQQKNGWTIAGGKVISYKGDMTTMELPKEVTELESILDIFTKDNYDDCKTFTVEEGSTSFKMEGGALLSYDGKILYGYFYERQNPNTLAWDTVEEIKPYAFYQKILWTVNSFSLTKLTKIGAYAFQGCNGIKSFTPFENLAAIPDHAFDGCNNLAGSFNSKAVTVGEGAFESTSSLEKAVFSALENLGANAFGRSSVLEISLPACIGTIGDGAFGAEGALHANFRLTFLGETPPANAAATMFKSSYTSPFAGTIFVPSAEAVEAYKAAAAFASVKDHIKKTPTASEEWTIVDGKVTGYTGDLTTVVLPATVTKMDSILEIFKDTDTFVKCTSFTVAADNENFEMFHGALVDKQHTTIYAYFGSEETSLDFSGFTKIKPYAFFGRLLATDNKTFSLGTVTELGEQAFYGCSGLTDFTPFTSLTEIPDFAFPGSGLTSITTAATKIGQYAFAWLDVTCSDFTSQTTWTKKLTGTLQSVTLTGENIVIGQYAFYAYKYEITAPFTIQHKVKSVGDNAFYFCTGLKDWTPFDDLETVPAAFSKTGFTTLTIKAKVIAAGAFKYCRSLTTVVLSNPELESIGKEAFQCYESGMPSCPLTSVTIKATSVPKVVDRGAPLSGTTLGYPFGDQSFKGTIYVRGNLIGQYQKADSWKFYYEHKYYQSGTWKPQSGAVDHSQFEADPQTPTVKVTFDSNEGSAVSEQNVWESGTAKRPADPVKLGYVFKGWFTDDNTFLNEYHFTETVTEPIELHAKWEPGTIVTFKWYEGKEEKITVETNGTVTKPETPVRDGYRFDKWVTTENGDEEFKFGETTISEETTIYAKWVKAWNVTFETGDGGSEVDAQLIDDHGHATQPEQTPTRTGYEFGGWYTKDGSANEDWGEEFNFTDTEITQDTTVYAKWTKKEAWNVDESGKITAYNGAYNVNIEIPASVKTLADVRDIFGKSEVTDGVIPFDVNFKAFKAAGVSLTVAAESEYFKIENDALVSYDGKTFYLYLGKTAPDWSKYSSIETWGFYSFVYCDVLTEATISNGQLNSYMFKGSALTKLTVNGTASAVRAGGVVNGADDLKTVVLDVTGKIGSSTFFSPSSASKVNDLTLGSKVTEIGAMAIRKGLDTTLTITILNEEAVVKLGAANFTGCTVTVYVPDTLVDTYKADNNWKMFTIKPVSEKAAAAAAAYELPEAILPSKKD